LRAVDQQKAAVWLGACCRALAWLCYPTP
jgi:hypothetical protein